MPNKVNRTNQNEWVAESQIVKDCGFCDEKTEIVVAINQIVGKKIDILMEKIPDKEWFAYLIGRKVSEGYLIDDLSIPEQEIASAAVEVTGTPPASDVVGTVHSHHTMGAFHSGIDLDYAASNHPVCLVVSHKEWAAKVQQPLPCRKKYLATAEVYLIDPLRQEMEAFYQAAKEKMTERVYAVTASKGHYFQPGLHECGLCGQDHAWDKLTWDREERIWLCPECFLAINEKDMEKIQAIKKINQSPPNNLEDAYLGLD